MKPKKPSLKVRAAIKAGGIMPGNHTRNMLVPRPRVSL